MQKYSGQFWSKRITMRDASAQICGNPMSNAPELLVICKVINIALQCNVYCLLNNFVGVIAW